MSDSAPRLPAFDFKQSASQTHIVLTIVAATLLAGGGCVLLMIATHGTSREDAGMLGAFIWLFFILGGSVVLVRSWRVPLRIEVGNEAFTLIDRHSGSEQIVPWEHVTRYRQDVLATDYVTRARLWLWVRADSGEHRIEIETDCDESARHQQFQALAAHVSGLLSRRGIRPDKRGK